MLSSAIGPVIADLSPQTYGAFTICPYNEVNETIRMIFIASKVHLKKADSTIAVYLQLGGSWFTNSSNSLVLVNMFCNIKPQILDVNVTYNYTGYVTLEPLRQTSTNPPINNSAVISTIMGALKSHLSTAQAPDMNIAIEEIFGVYTNAYYASYIDSDYGPLANLMVVCHSL